MQKHLPKEFPLSKPKARSARHSKQREKLEIKSTHITLLAKSKISGIKNSFPLLHVYRKKSNGIAIRLFSSNKSKNLLFKKKCAIIGI